MWLFLQDQRLCRLSPLLLIGSNVQSTWFNFTCLNDFWSPSITPVFIFESPAQLPPFMQVFHLLHAIYLGRGIKMRHLTLTNI